MTVHLPADLHMNTCPLLAILRVRVVGMDNTKLQKLKGSKFNQCSQKINEIVLYPSQHKFISIGRAKNTDVH